MTKEELRGILFEEKTLYLGTDPKRRRRMRFQRHKRWRIWRALRDFRYAQYFNDLRVDREAGRLKRDAARFAFRFYDRKRNISGEKAGIEIGLGSRVGAGVDIWHGGVVINGTLGAGCVLHGNNVIGNKGNAGHNATPVLGDNADLGAGAIVIGGVELAENCVVGAGAVVVRSCDTPGAVLAGVPAKKIK